MAVAVVGFLLTLAPSSFPFGVLLLLASLSYLLRPRFRNWTVAVYVAVVVTVLLSIPGGKRFESWQGEQDARRVEETKRQEAKRADEAKKQSADETARTEARLQAMAADMQGKMAAGTWREAAVKSAGIKAVRADYPGLAEAEKTIAENIRLLDLDGFIKDAEFVVADPVQCKEPKPVANAWNKIKDTKPTDRQWTRAVSVVAKLEGCRLLAKRALSDGMRSIMIAQREAWAAKADTAFLDQGMNCTVSLGGANKDRATLTWALMSRAAVHKLTGGGSMAEDSFLGGLQKIGFRRVTFADGFDESWYYTLDPQDESDGGTMVLEQFGISSPLKLQK